MSKGSKYFDSLRAKPSRTPEAAPAKKICQWKGCQAAGTHKAPMGRDNEGKYYHFCVDHVRQYNASYNYFTGMSDRDIETFQKDAITGHRPTWKTGTGGSTASGGRWAKDPVADASEAGNDPHNFFAWRAKRAAPTDAAPRRYIKPLERKSLETLHLSETATADDIKAKFKELVKRHHPDANGGDKRSEDKLREIIQAYNHLKQAGLVGS
jgi:curved DNA-binding protein CbpA